MDEKKKDNIYYVCSNPDYIKCSYQEGILLA